MLLRSIAALCLILAAPAARAEITRYGAFTHDSAQPNILTYEGEIDRSALRDFRAALRAHPITLLVLISPGGSINAGLDMAALIRDKGLATAIPAEAECASACAFLFTAGVARQADGKLGVHQFISENDRSASLYAVEADTQVTVAQIVTMLTDFGVAPSVFVKMFQTSNEDMYWFTPDEMAQDGLTTGTPFASDLALWARAHAQVAEARPERPSGQSLLQAGQLPATSSDPFTNNPPASGTPRTTSLPGALIGPGFDCALATQPSETAICTDVSLASLDLALTKRVDRLASRMTAFSAAQFRVEQLQWLAQRNSCQTDRACLEAEYLDRLDELGY